jgi:small subunit ribosomal protein S6
MFLFDTSRAGEYPAMEAEVQRLMQRAQGEVITCKRWDERKLAYEIDGRKRGCYVLAYFKAPPDKIAGLERDAQLSEAILRILVLSAERVTPEQMNAPTPAETETTDRDGALRRRPYGRDDGDFDDDRRPAARPSREPVRDLSPSDVDEPEGAAVRPESS